ncbi:MAG: hypothetical protein RIS47_793 [Bacteroidota bacterium]|jgi:hypothetical protein
MSNTSFFVEVDACLRSKSHEPVCGDYFVSKKIKSEQRVVATLSDGLGSGIKANVLATMTATMAICFTERNEPIQYTAESIMRTLPIDSVRQISYATFTIIDIEPGGETKVVEYGNPNSIVMRGGKQWQPKYEKICFQTFDGKTRELNSYSFAAQKEDRIICFTDGVSQSGIGTKSMPFGWEAEGVTQFATDQLAKNPKLSASELSRKIVERSYVNDTLKHRDDTSCAVIYFRNPRKMLVCTGPPFDKSRDAAYVKQVESFQGHKIVCGGTTSQIIARALNREIEVSLDSVSHLPPSSRMEGFDLITEGIITLGKVVYYLEKLKSSQIQETDPAAEIVRLFFESDIIVFILGTKINNAHQDPSLPVELEIRRNVVKKIVALLEGKFLKEVQMHFI